MRELTDKQIKDRLTQILLRLQHDENMFFGGCFAASLLACAIGVVVSLSVGSNMWGKVVAGAIGFVGMGVFYCVLGYAFHWQGVGRAKKAFDRSFPKGTEKRKRAVDLLGTLSGDFKNEAKELYEAVSPPKMEWGAMESAESQLEKGLLRGSTSSMEETGRSAASPPEVSKTRPETAERSEDRRDSFQYDYIPLEPERSPGKRIIDEKRDPHV